MGLLLREIEEATCSNTFVAAAERCLDTRRHRALSVNRTLKRQDRRNTQNKREGVAKLPMFLRSRARPRGSICSRKKSW